MNQVNSYCYYNNKRIKVSNGEIKVSPLPHVGDYICVRGNDNIKLYFRVARVVHDYHNHDIEITVVSNDDTLMKYHDYITAQVPAQWIDEWITDVK